MTRKPVPRRSPGPKNPSRGAGAPAPASAAATAASFYDPGASTTAATDRLGHALGDAQQAPKQAHVDAVRRAAVPIAESPGSADASLSPMIEPGAGDIDSEIARIRQIRRPLGAYALKLALEQRRGYHRHWFNDVAGRVLEAKENGWAHVKDDKGQPLKRVVGTGRDNGALYAYAMEIPEVFWLEDMSARHTAAAQVIESTKANPFKAAPGASKPSDHGKFYDPVEGGAGPLQVVKGG